MSPAANCFRSRPGPTAQHTAFQNAGGLSMPGVLETLSRGYVSQLLVPKGSHQWNALLPLGF